jgi:diketogulonate reductase-like aldo/keto reductase
MQPSARIVQGHSFPAFLYGTAWKEYEAERCVRSALAAGFRGIDTANQRKHYFEEGVGRALAGAFAEGRVSREDLFLQTKFTYARRQDHRLPYDANASHADQVEQSFRRSLLHLGVRAIDAFILHGPMSGRGLTPADHDV